ncbi:MAG: hypothetical protein IT299_00370 [Dehalococcoidia bacterium]|nr:hypothetical protein [Dehalococcoidia bacterium]
MDRVGRLEQLSARYGLLALGWFGLAGTVAQLVLDRHWSSPTQAPPWLALAALAGALTVVGRAQGSRRLARWLAGVAVAIALAGVYFHIEGNYQAGPLDQRFSATWEGMSVASRLWTAASQGVGPSPVLASGALIMIALVVGMESLRQRD